jgi:hypothetical protein
MRRESQFLFVNPIHRNAKSQMREGRKTTSPRITSRAKPAETNTTRISERNETASRVVPSSRARHFRQSLTSLRLKISASSHILKRARFESAPVRPTRDRAIRLLCTSSRDKKKKGNDDDVFKNKRAGYARVPGTAWFNISVCCVVCDAKKFLPLLALFSSRTLVGFNTLKCCLSFPFLQIFFRLVETARAQK